MIYNFKLRLYTIKGPWLILNTDIYAQSVMIIRYKGIFESQK